MTSRRGCGMVEPMRIAFFFLASGVLALVGCDGDGGADASTDGPMVMFRDSGLSGPSVFSEWRMRCNDGDCAPMDAPARGVQTQNLEDGAVVTCDAQVDGTERRMDIEVMSPEGYGWRIAGARIPIEGGRVIERFCEMRVFEPDDVTTIGACGANPPSATRPCQLQRIRIDQVDGASVLSGEFRCIGMQQMSASSNLRDITSPTSPTEFATFELTGCIGL